MDMHVGDDVKCKPRKRENKEPTNKEKIVEGVHYIRERKSEFSQQWGKSRTWIVEVIWDTKYYFSNYWKGKRIDTNLHVDDICYLYGVWEKIM